MTTTPRLGRQPKLHMAYGRARSMKEWAADIGVSETTLRLRMKRMTLEAALSLGGPLDSFRHTHGGLSLTIAEWSRHTGIDRAVISARLRRGYPISIAISTSYGRKGHVVRTPVNGPKLSREASRTRSNKSHPRYFTIGDVTKSRAEWAEYAGISYRALITRMHRGRTLAEALAMPIGNYRGVGKNFDPSKGTGAGSTAQETPNLTFHDEAAE